MLSGALNKHGAPPQNPMVSGQGAAHRGAARPSVPWRGEIPGLAAWLQALGLAAYACEIQAWARKHGASTLEDVAENLESLRDALPLKPLEARRLGREGPAIARMLYTELFEPSNGCGLGGAADIDVWDAPPPSAWDVVQQSAAPCGTDSFKTQHSKAITAKGVARSKTKKQETSQPAAAPHDLQTGAVVESVNRNPASIKSKGKSKGKGKNKSHGRGANRDEQGNRSKDDTDELKSKSADTDCRSVAGAYDSRVERSVTDLYTYVYVSLRVDSLCGAGLSLEWRPNHGYSVIDIETRPGQPGLRIGDTIQAISGTRLDNAASEEALEERFGSCFKDGAQLEIKRERTLHHETDDRDAEQATTVTTLKEDEFEAALRVKHGGGAGLGLVWFPPEGYMVETIDRHPGQPMLRPGDVLRRVGKFDLQGFPSEEKADSVLARGLGDGVTVLVYRPRSDSKTGDLVAVPTCTETLWIPSIGLGTWSWGNDSFGHGTWGGGSEDAIADTSHAALECGCFFFDTAPTYGRGTAEKILGRLEKDGRYAVVATKYYPRGTDRNLAGAMISCAQQAAHRLCKEGPIDLLQLHKRADEPVSLDEQADALAAVVQQGVARAVGVCNFSLQELELVHGRLRKAHGIPLSTCQVEFSLLRQLPLASGLVAGCRNMGIVVLAYSPLGMGRLSGRHDVLRGDTPRWGRRGNEARPFGASLDSEPRALATLVQALRDIGAKYRATPVQVALNWILSQGVVAIAGARSRAQAKENAAAMGWRLSESEVSCLSKLGARGKTSDFQHG